MDSVTTARVHQRGLAGSADNNKYRSVTLIEREVWNDQMRRLGGKASPSGRRANLMVSGIALVNSMGRIMRIGKVRLRIAGETKPCEQMDTVIPGLREVMYPNWGGGAFAQVLDEGEISVGDSVEWLDDETASVEKFALSHKMDADK
jgi:MOSC domain-containing protein YiiM